MFTMFIGRPLISKGSVDQSPTTEQGRTGISWKYAEKIRDVINHYNYYLFTMIVMCPSCIILQKSKSIFGDDAPFPIYPTWSFLVTFGWGRQLRLWFVGPWDVWCRSARIRPAAAAAAVRPGGAAAHGPGRWGSKFPGWNTSASHPSTAHSTHMSHMIRKKWGKNMGKNKASKPGLLVIVITWRHQWNAFNCGI